MKTNSDTDLDFNFKKIDKNNSISMNEEDSNIVDVTLNTLATQFTLVLSYVFLALIVFKLTSISLLGFAFILSKGLVTLNAISSALINRKKGIKLQIFNNTLNLGILLYLFKYDGFNTLVNLFQSIF